MAGVYVIQNTVNGKCYVGSTTCKFTKRWGEHISLLRNSKHFNIHLQRSFIKHGIDNFKLWEAEECDLSVCAEREQWWMDLFQPAYNLAPRANSMTGYKFTEEQLKKLSESHIQEKCKRGHNLSEAYVAKSGARICRKCSKLRRCIWRELHRKKRIYTHNSHCLRGHPYSGDNLYVSPKGERACRACINLRARKFRPMVKDRTMCKNGHIRNESNVYIYDGVKRCRECHSTHAARYHLKVRKCQ